MGMNISQKTLKTFGTRKSVIWKNLKETQQSPRSSLLQEDWREIPQRRTQWPYLILTDQHVIRFIYESFWRGASKGFFFLFWQTEIQKSGEFGHFCLTHLTQLLLDGRHHGRHLWYLLLRSVFGQQLSGAAGCLAGRLHRWHFVLDFLQEVWKRYDTEQT